MKGKDNTRAAAATLRTFSRRNGRPDFFLPSIVLILFGLLNLLTGLFYDQADTLIVNNTIIGSETVGPITIEEPNTVLNVTIRLPVPYQSWAFAEAVLLDGDGEDLSSFGRELWDETGRDEDGPWRDVRNTFRHKLTIPEPGTYRIGVIAEFGRQGQARGAINPDARASVVVHRAGGSAIPHMVAGFGLILLAVVAQGIADHRFQLLSGMAKIAFTIIIGFVMIRVIFF